MWQHYEKTDMWQHYEKTVLNRKNGITYQQLVSVCHKVY